MKMFSMAYSLQTFPSLLFLSFVYTYPRFTDKELFRKLNDPSITAPELAQLANQLVDSNEYDKALNFYYKAIELDFENPWYLKQRAICYALMHKVEKAEEDVMDVRQMNPHDLDIEALEKLVTLLSTTFFVENEWRDDEEYAQKLNDPSTTHAELFTLANDLFYLKKYRKALDFYNRAIEKNSKDANYLLSRAICYVMLRGHLSEVRSDLMKVKELKPDKDIDLHWRMALLNNGGRPQISDSETLEIAPGTCSFEDSFVGLTNRVNVRNDS